MPSFWRRRPSSVFRHRLRETSRAIMLKRYTRPFHSRNQYCVGKGKKTATREREPVRHVNVWVVRETEEGQVYFLNI